MTVPDNHEDDIPQERPRAPLFERRYERRSVSAWLVPLIIIIAVIVFLPRVMEMLE